MSPTGRTSQLGVICDDRRAAGRRGKRPRVAARARAKRGSSSLMAEGHGGGGHSWEERCSRLIDRPRTGLAKVDDSHLQQHLSSRGEGTRRITMFLRRFAGPLLASVKESTGIVGLDVVPNAREVLISLYQQTLKAVQPIPESAQYRKSVEALTQHRLKVCQEEADWQNIEQRIQGGQVEELIVQAKDELQLIPKMAEWKPWEVPEGYKVEVIEDDDSIPSHVPIHKQL